MDLNGIRIISETDRCGKYRPSYMYNLKVYFSGQNFRGIPVSYVALSGIPRVPKVPPLNSDRCGNPTIRRSFFEGNHGVLTSIYGCLPQE